MTNHYDKETAEMIREIGKGNKNATTKMILKKKVGFPAPELIVSPHGSFRIGNYERNASTADYERLGATNDADLNAIISGLTSGNALQTLGGIFAKKPVGDKGWQSYLASVNRPVGPQYYPTLNQIMAANFITDAQQKAAIQSTYNQSTGSGNEGDWHFAVTNANPITIDWYKGDTQHFKSVANVSAPVSSVPVTQGYNSTPSAYTASPVSTVPPTIGSSQWLAQMTGQTGGSQMGSQPVTLQSAAGSVKFDFSNPVIKVGIVAVIIVAVFLIAKKIL